MLIHTHLPNGEVNMAEYTTEENQELLDTIKRPVRYYRISLWGYGGESAYIGLTKEGYDYWNDLMEEDGDEPMTDYLLEAEDLETFSGPKEADFLLNDGDTDEWYRSAWYEAPTEAAHQYGVDYGHAKITIEEVEDHEPTSNVIKTVVDNVDLDEWCVDNEVELEMDVVDAEEPDYVLQMMSSEKGIFFEAVLESKGPFDLNKLKIYTTEYWNGDDTVENIEYDGQDIDNWGGGTDGKGYSAHLWRNVVD